MFKPLIKRSSRSLAEAIRARPLLFAWANRLLAASPWLERRVYAILFSPPIASHRREDSLSADEIRILQDLREAISLKQMDAH